MPRTQPGSRFFSIEVSDPDFESEELRHITAKSPSLKARADVTLHVPEAARGRAGVPLVILLHGIYGSHWGWTRSGGAHRTNERLLRDGQIGPLILAMPSDGLWGDGSGYVTHGKADFEAWIAEDVPALVEEVLGRGTCGALFVGGLSMGGFGALRMGARHPGRIAGMSGLSSATHLDQLKAAVQQDPRFDGVAAEDHCLFRTLSACSSLPPFRFECGTEDFLLEANRELHRRLEMASIPHEYEEHPGAHAWQYWRQRLPDTLRYFSRIAYGPLPNSARHT